MKQCPVCKTSYTDDSLRFCLADGATLTAVMDEQPTIVRDNLRIDIPSESLRQNIWPEAPPAGDSSGFWFKVLVVILLLGFLIVAAAGVLGFVFYYNSGSSTNTNVASKSPTPTPRATPDNEKQSLQDEIANLQKKVADQKKPSVITEPLPQPDRPSTVTATANSPGDGFLALRSEPNSETGERITRIPHGERIEIGACGRYITTGRNNRGRWCRASYKGLSGWVFDAFVRY